MTALEITHSRTESEIDALVKQILPHADVLTDFTVNHRCRLVKPMVSFDAQVSIGLLASHQAQAC